MSKIKIKSETLLYVYKYLIICSQILGLTIKVIWSSQQLTKEHAVHIYKLIKLSFDGQFDPELHNIHLLALHAIKSFPFAVSLNKQSIKATFIEQIAKLCVAIVSNVKFL